MSRNLLKFIVALMLPLFGLAQFVNADENFCISVYKDGSSSQMFYFTLLSGDEYLCDNIVIDNYTGNPNDYKYWIGKNNKFEGLSANFNLGSSNSSQGSVSGTDFISSCTTGAFSVKIYSGSGDKNWYPHNWTCETVPEPGSCDVQTKGASIPANTIIFYDNSDKLFSGEIWLSVPTESGNGNASNVNQGSYHRNKDKWYQMHKVDGDIWQATITTTSSYGRMSFWNKDGHAADDVWQNTVVFQAPYTTGKNIYKPDASKKCYNSNRQTDVYFKGTWGLRTGLFLNLSSTDRKIDDTNPITLKAEAIGVTGTGYMFEYRPFDSDNWETLATQSSPEYILSGKGLPVKSTYYRVKYGTATSPEVRLAVLINCDEGGSAKNILKFDFGTLTELKGANSRTSSSDMAKAYTYQPWAKKINDGYYAVVATPYYCGCGEGSDMGQTVDQCEGNNMWFRDIKDHTLGDKGTAGNYGGMLMINFSDAKSKTAYEHELTSSDKAAFVKGSTLSFSAYFASAAKPEAVDVKINMKLMIQYKPVGSEEWITKAELENKVEYDDNWKFGNTSIDIDDPAGDYRVVIENYSAAGTGNDALIDDISLDLCVPTFPVSFYDEATDSEYDTYTYKQMDETQIIRISKQNYGHGDQNCVVLLSVDDSKKAGEAGRYELIDVMNLTSYKGADYYSTTKSVNELLGGNVGTGKLQALVTKPDICSDATKFEELKSKLANGTIKPLDSADYMFSTNLLTYSIACNGNFPISLNNTKLCDIEGTKPADYLPKLTLEFGDYISNNATCKILEDNNAVTEEISISSTELVAGKVTVDLNSYISNIDITPGVHNFSVNMYEKNSSGEVICNRKSQADVKLTIQPRPTATISGNTTICEGSSTNITFTISSGTPNYTINYKDGNTDKTKSGITSAGATNVSVKPAETTTYTLTKVTDGNGCYSEYTTNNTVTVNVGKIPTIAEKTAASCSEDLTTYSIEVTVSEGTVTCNKTATVTHTGNDWKISGIAAGTNCTLTVTTTMGCTNTLAVTAPDCGCPAVPAPTGAQGDSYCAGSSKKAISVDTPAEGYRIDWYDAPTGGSLVATGASFTPSAVGTYYAEMVQIVSGCKSSTRTAVELIENSLPIATISGDAAVCRNGELQLTGSGADNYSWNGGAYTTTSTFDVLTATAGTQTITLKVKDANGCESAENPKTITVKDIAVKADITADGQTVCKGSTVTLTASTSTVVPNPIFKWYSDAALTSEVHTGSTYNVTTMTDVTYYVSVQNDDYCENVANDGRDVSISLKNPVTSVTLHEKDGDEYDLGGVPTAKRNLGMETEKVLTIDPADASNYTLRWYIGDTEFDGSFPRKPYVDQVYKVVLVDECGNVHIANAGTQVEWPTVFMPYDNSTNKDFVVDIDGGIELLVFDRSGNMVAHTYNGWDGFANQNGNNKIAMPGLYYYKAILPDGSVKKGNVEVFKK